MENSSELPLVSVVIPAYNSGEFIEKCVNSVVSQTYKNIEIILVNDGSSDNSGEVCDMLATQNTTICVIHKQNAGVSAARNDGIVAAKGKYLLFIDSDDYVEDNLISDCVYELEKNDADLTIFGYIVKYARKNTSSIRTIKFPQTKRADVLENPEIVSYIRSHFLLESTCNKLYKLSVIKDNNILFDKKFFGEDLVFNFKYLEFCNVVYLMDKAYYHYIKRLFSATENYHHNRFENSKEIFFSYIFLCEKLGNPEVLVNDAKLFLIDDLTVCMYDSILHEGSNLSFKEKYRYIKSLVDDKIVRELLNDKSTIPVTGRLTRVLIGLIKKRKYLLVMLVCSVYPLAIRIYKRLKKV